MAKPTVLVTGGAGYIGSHICQKLIQQSYNLIVVDNLSKGFLSSLPKNIIFYQEDIGNPQAMAQILAKHKITAVIHMAASVSVDESVRNPILYYKNNTLNAFQLICACLENQVQYFVFSSTAAVYGTPSKLPVCEDAPLKPESPYGFSKAMTEKILSDVTPLTQMRFAILRYFNVAGAMLDGSIGQKSPKATHLIKSACEAASGARSELNIFGNDYPTRDGTAERDYIHVEDLADLHILTLDYLCNGGKSDIFNCGYGHGVTVKEVVETMKQVSGKNFSVKNAPRRPGDVAQIFADNTKLRQALKWNPKFDDLQLICRTAWSWESSQQTSKSPVEDSM